MYKHSFHEFLGVQEKWQGSCFFFDFWIRKKSSGDKVAAVPYTLRYVDFISDMNSGPAVDLLAEHFVWSSRSQIFGVKKKVRTSFREGFYRREWFNTILWMLVRSLGTFKKSSFFLKIGSTMSCFRDFRRDKAMSCWVPTSISKELHYILLLAKGGYYTWRFRGAFLRQIWAHGVEIVKSHEIDTKEKRYDFGSMRIVSHVQNNVEKDSETFVSRISGCRGKVAGILFSRFLYFKKIVGGQVLGGVL